MKKFVKIISITLASVIGLLLIAISVVVNFIFTPEKLTPAVNKTLKEIITDGKASIGRVDITFFSSFPHFSIVMDSVVVADSSNTVLLNLEKAILDVNPMAYLTKKAVVVSDLEFSKPIVSISFDSLGRSNLDMFRSTPDTSSVQSSQMSIKEMISSVDIKRVKVADGEVSVKDDRNSSFSSLKGLNLDLKGRLAERGASLIMKLNAQSINLAVGEKKLLNNFSFDINTDLKVNMDSLSLHAERADVTIGNIGLSTSGEMQIDTISKRLICDLRFGLASPSLETLIGYIPQSVLKPDQQFSASGSVELSGTIKGFYGENSIPSIKAKAVIADGKFQFSKMKYGVQKLETAINLNIDGSEQSNSFIEVDNFVVESDAGVNLNFKGKITDILGNYNTRFDITSNINIDRITDIFPLADGIVVKGNNKTELKGQFTKHILKSRDYGSIYLDGKSDFNNLLITINGSKLIDSTNRSYLYIEMKNGRFNFGNNSKVAKVTKGEANLAADISFSGVGFRDKSGLEVSLSNVQLSAAAQMKKHKEDITPMIGELTLGKIDFAITDTLKAHLTSSKAILKIVPSKESSTKPDISLSLRADSTDLTAIQSETNASLRVAALNISMTPDSTRKSKFSINGFIGFDGLRAYSSQFPVEIAMHGSLISFKNNTIDLNKTKITVGDSNITATGHVENFIGNLLKKSDKDIISNLSITSSSIDLAQLYVASLKAMPNVAAAKIEEELQKDPKEAMQIMLIPKNIVSNLSLNVKRISFGELKADNIDGKMDIKNGAMTLRNFNFFAAGADMNIAGTYHPKSDSLATAIFYLNAKKIVIKELVKFIPAIDSIMPVLKSFDGTIDFNMAARTDISKEMTIQLPTLESVMSLSGTNLVLMDGETFRRISKMLLFKNKEKNTIDSLGVNIVVRKGGVVDVPPFEIEIDRYRAIIGGTQTIDFKNFDINYAYNVSIIKSPLPIKAGVDIKGKNGDFDYKITKAKLKKSDFLQIQTNVDSIKNSILKLQ